MGQEISYCAKCAIRILSSDIEKGKAFRIGNQTVCKDCAPQVAPGLSAEELRLASSRTPRGGTPLPAPVPREPVSSITPRAMPRVGGTPALPGTRRAVVEAAPPLPKKPLILGLIGGGVVLLLVVIGLALGGKASVPPPPTGAPGPRREERPAAKVEDANTRAARLAWEKANTFIKERPGDLEGQIALFEEAFRTAQGTEYFEQARAARDALLVRRMADIPREMAALNDQGRPLMEKEEFKAVLDLLAQARKKRAAAEWTALIDGRVQEIGKAIDRILDAIKDRAAADKLEGKSDEVRKARERVARWGLPDRLEALDAFLSAGMEVRALARGLAAWWKMDEGSGKTVEDASGGGRQGTLAGGASWADGRLGKALSFDGQQAHVRIHPFFEQIQNTFTVALWALPAETLAITPEGYGGAPELKGHRFAVFPTHGKHFGNNHAGAGISIGTNGVSLFEHADAYFPSPVVHLAALRGWTHVAAVYADRVPSLYVNGARVRAGERSGKAVHPSCELGGGSGAYGTYQGLLDDVRVYDRALSEGEIRILAMAPPERPWQALFDGKTVECLRSVCRDGWKVEEGAIVRTGVRSAAQTAQEFEDGEVRVRFEVEGLESIRFYIRQGEGGAHYVKFDGPSVRSLEGGTRELVFTGKGDSVTAALDGKDVPVIKEGNPRRGCLQFNGTGRVIRIRSIEYREPK
jgi:hypothetical protein